MVCSLLVTVELFPAPWTFDGKPVDPIEMLSVARSDHIRRDQNRILLTSALLR